MGREEGREGGKPTSMYFVNQPELEHFIVNHRVMAFSNPSPLELTKNQNRWGGGFVKEVKADAELEASVLLPSSEYCPSNSAASASRSAATQHVSVPGQRRPNRFIDRRCRAVRPVLPENIQGRDFLCNPNR